MSNIKHVTATEADAQAIVTYIDNNCNFPNSDISTWDIPRERSTDGKWYITHCDICNMDEYSGEYTNETWASDWPMVIE